jgi:hypothetical protein
VISHSGTGTGIFSKQNAEVLTRTVRYRYRLSPTKYATVPTVPTRGTVLVRIFVI